MINHDKRYIYIHIPKTGGSSVEEQLLLEDGVVVDRPLRFMPKDIRDKYTIGSFGGSQHFPMYKFDESVQKEYFCFTFVRNPYSRVVSEYKWQQRELKKTFKCFEEFLEKSANVPWHDLPQHEFINQNVNYIGRFEKIQKDFNIICNKIGIPKQKLPHKNKTKHKHYTEYYDDVTREIVAEKYAKDIELFGYEFGE